MPRLQFLASWKFSHLQFIFVLIFCWFFCSFHIMISWVQSLVISLILHSVFIAFCTTLFGLTQPTKCWKFAHYFQLFLIIIPTSIHMTFRGSFRASLSVNIFIIIFSQESKFHPATLHHFYTLWFTQPFANKIQPYKYIICHILSVDIT